MKDILRDLVRDSRFLVCAIVLAAAALGIETVAGIMELHFRKLPVPLRKSLDQFDVAKLSHYKLVRKVSIPSEVEDALGTKDYLQFILEDTSISDPKQPGKYVNFFVTYYTGDPDQVPHVPEVCYMGSGKEPGNIRNMEIELPGIGLDDDRLPVRVVTFRDTRSMPGGHIPVIYFFSVNGAFEPDRLSVRLRLSDLRVKYSYLSKVEIAFGGRPQPDTAQVLELTKRLLAEALPVLMEEHWPDWNEVIRQE